MVGDSAVSITDAEPFNSADSKFNQQVPFTAPTFAENSPFFTFAKKLSRKLIRQKRTTQACHQSYLRRFNSNVKRFLIFKTVDAPDEWSW